MWETEEDGETKRDYCTDPQLLLLTIARCVIVKTLLSTFASWLGMINRRPGVGSGPQRGVHTDCKLALTQGLTESNWLNCRRHLHTSFHYAFNFRDCFRLSTQVLFLIDGSLKGQYTTQGLDMTSRLTALGRSNHPPSSIRTKVVCCKSLDHPVAGSRTAQSLEFRLKVLGVITHGQNEASLERGLTSLRVFYSLSLVDLSWLK